MDDIFNQKPELNITPLVDVMLVLLVILMITAPVSEYQEDINLPKGSKTKVADKNQKVISITLKKTREVFINQQGYKLENFVDSFGMLSKKYKNDTPVHIKADKELKYDDIIFILNFILLFVI